MAWSDTLLSGVGLDATRFSGSFSGRPEGSEVATAVLTLAACAGLLRAFDRLPHLKPWRRGNPPLSSAAELRSRMAPPRVATPAESLVLPATCAIVPGTAATPTALDPTDIPQGVTPALILVNRKSGGHTGEVLLSCFTDLLNPLQVWDISDGGPGDALTLFRRVPRLRVLACGGDGTIGWVAEAMRGADLQPGAALCPVPLGTGNDFSRALGWGGGFDGDTLRSVGRLLHTIAGGYTSYIDRWQVAQVSPPEHTVVTVGRRPHTETVRVTESQLAAAAAGSTAGGGELTQLRWDFSTVDHDIGFEVLFTPDHTSAAANGSAEASSVRVVRSRERLPAHEAPVIGGLQVEQAGTYELRWDNSYSRLRRKHLMHRVWLSSSAADDAPTPATSDGPSRLHQSTGSTEGRIAATVAGGAEASAEAALEEEGSRGGTLKQLVMNNYLGIGVDAEVTLMFHRLRTDNPRLFSNRIVNKIGYLWIGAKLSLRRYVKYFGKPGEMQGNLADRVRLFADGKRVQLPPGLSGIIVLNLPSFGGGLDMWTDSGVGEGWSAQAMNDGRVEVVGVSSSLDIALQGGLAGLGMQVAVRLAQASTVRLELKHTAAAAVAAAQAAVDGSAGADVGSGGSSPRGSASAAEGEEEGKPGEAAGSMAVQCDGEPWLACPGTAIAVASAGRTPVVRPRIHAGHDVLRVVDSVIAEAARDGVLGEAQRLEIAQRLAARLPS